MQQIILNTWNSVMEHSHNPLRNIGDIQVRHMVLQVLAWMWCIIFAMSTGSITVFGVSAIAHALVIAGIVITVVTFEAAQQAPERFTSSGHGFGGDHD